MISCELEDEVCAHEVSDLTTHSTKLISYNSPHGVSSAQHVLMPAPGPGGLLCLCRFSGWQNPTLSSQPKHLQPLGNLVVFSNVCTSTADHFNFCSYIFLRCPGSAERKRNAIFYNRYNADHGT